MKTIKIVLLIILFVLISGCSIKFNSSDSAVSDSGVYKTNNKGDKWSQKILVPNISGRPNSLGDINADILIMDPSDTKALYWGAASGMFYSYDGANNWQSASGLGKVEINDIAIDNANKCVIYAVSSNKVYKSTDCNRSWSQIYFDNNTKLKINSIVVDHYDSNIVYIGTSRGEIIKSSNGGGEWQTLNRFKNSVEKIIVSPQDSRIIIATVGDKSIHRSSDSGTNWEDLEDKLSEFKSRQKTKDLMAIKGEAKYLFLITNSELIKSTDDGESWLKISLITPEKEGNINAATVNPQNTQEIYYVTNTAFYRSADGGTNWTSKKLPTTGAGWQLIIDPQDPKVIYMGVKKLKSK